MTATDRLRLTFEYFGSGPGVSGVSELSVEPTAAAVRLRWVADIGEPDDHAEIVELPVDCGWREIVAALGDREIYAFYGDFYDGGEYACPWQMGLEGPRTFAAELIALAWAGPPFLDFARAFSVATDEQIGATHKEVGSFLKMEFVMNLTQLHRLLREIDIPLVQLVVQHRSTTLDLAAMHEIARIRFRELGGEE